MLPRQAKAEAQEGCQGPGEGVQEERAGKEIAARRQGKQQAVGSYVGVYERESVSVSVWRTEDSD